ncbi:hypothetical protein J1N35_037845 [Gossypium stocksii]|uniref:Uncharacterized protein n=1 Tax=Gossypium stocksii TaxID=47602 RepID=A0A9D3UKR0_9ROSI|nr:hypothetical protein J1N35_037845 [Gossypium stocksii]
MDRPKLKKKAKELCKEDERIVNLSLSDSDISNRMRVILREANNTWALRKKLGFSVHGNEEEVLLTKFEVELMKFVWMVYSCLGRGVEIMERELFMAIIENNGFPVGKKHERIETTVAKAKEIRRLADNMVQLGKEAACKNIPILVDAEREREGLDDLLNFASYAICSTRFLQLFKCIYCNSKAFELFVQDLCDHMYEIVVQRGAKTMNSLHLDLEKIGVRRGWIRGGVSRRFGRGRRHEHERDGPIGKNYLQKILMLIWKSTI